MGKICRSCHIEKPYTNFSIRETGLTRKVCKSCYNRVNKLWRSKNPDKVKLYRMNSALYVKNEVFSNYGTICQCCGEKEIKFLSIDHIEGGGNKHRKEINTKSGTHFYRWLKRNNFPTGYQVLCHNCNQAKGYYGECPHQTLNKLNSQ